MSTETSRPTVDLTDAKRVIEETTKRLLEERNWIIQDYLQRAMQLEADREKELQRNESMLLEMGMNVEDIPPIPHLSLFEGQKTRKLEHSQIKMLLKGFMKQNQEFTSPQIIGYLSITYTDFRNFLKSNPDFILPKGKNKGRVYYLNSN
jgi:hypothetical protein